MEDNTMEITNEDMTLLSLEDLAGATLDDIVEAPEIVNEVPAGEYRLKIVSGSLKGKNKDGATKYRINILLGIVETKSLVNPEDIPEPDGTMFMQGFNYDTQGLPYFKTFVKNATKWTTVNGIGMQELLDQMKEVEFDAKVITVTNDEGYKNIRVQIVK